MISPQTIINADITQLATRYGQLKNISLDDALRAVIRSRTYAILTNPDTGLCFEMTDYVYDMFLEEVEEMEATHGR